MKKSIDWFDIMTGILGVLAILLSLIVLVALTGALFTAPDSSFNTSALETWCGNTEGEIRMVGAWAKSEDIVEDETGELWSVDVPLSNDDFYLLWIDDMGTSAVEDDEIIKVWSEVYN